MSKPPKDISMAMKILRGGGTQAEAAASVGMTREHLNTILRKDKKLHEITIEKNAEIIAESYIERGELDIREQIAWATGRLRSIITLVEKDIMTNVSSRFLVKDLIKAFDSFGSYVKLLSTIEGLNQSTDNVINFQYNTVAKNENQL